MIGKPDNSRDYKVSELGGSDAAMEMSTNAHVAELSDEQVAELYCKDQVTEMDSKERAVEMDSKGCIVGKESSRYSSVVIVKERFLAELAAPDFAPAVPPK